MHVCIGLKLDELVDQLEMIITFYKFCAFNLFNLYVKLSVQH